MFVAAFAISTFAPSMTAAAASYDDEFVALINQKRAANGLQPVSLNSTLDNAAETRAEELTEKTHGRVEIPHGRVDARFYVYKRPNSEQI